MQKWFRFSHTIEIEREIVKIQLRYGSRYLPYFYCRRRLRRRRLRISQQQTKRLHDRCYYMRYIFRNITGDDIMAKT